MGGILAELCEWEGCVRRQVVVAVVHVCGSGKLFRLQWRSGGEGLDSGLSVSECVWVWLVCGEVSGWVEIVGDCGLCVSDLGGLRLSG